MTPEPFTARVELLDGKGQVVAAEDEVPFAQAGRAPGSPSWWVPSDPKVANTERIVFSATAGEVVVSTLRITTSNGEVREAHLEYGGCVLVPQGCEVAIEPGALSTV